MEQQNKIGYKKVGTKEKLKVNYDVPDIYKSYKNDGGKLDIVKFRAIIREVNEYYAERLSLGHNILLPLGFGKLGPRKMPTSIVIKNGKVVNNYSIDWGKTKELWRNDEQAYRDRVKIKLPTNYNYIVYWYKDTVRIKNKSFFRFKPARSLKLKTRENVINHKTDAIPISNLIKI